MKKGKNSNHQTCICKTFIRFLFVFYIVFVLKLDLYTDQQLIAISAIFILIAPVADWVIDWIYK